MDIAPFPTSSEATPLAAAHFSLGNFHALRNNFTEAQVHFRHSIEFAPHLATGHFALGFTHNKLGQHAEAIAAYTIAIRLCPTFASAWLNLGVALNADGQSHLAPHCYLQALATSPACDPASLGTHISAHLNLGHFARNSRSFPRAQHHYETALSLSRTLPDRLPEIYVAFAYFHLEQSQFSQAWQSIRQAESTHAPNPEIPNAKGILLLAEQATKQGEQPQNRLTRRRVFFPGVEEAIQSFQQAEGLGHKTAPSNRGNALLRLGKIPEALAAHHQAVDRDPHHPGARYNLALTQLRSGNFREGWHNYESRWQFREVHPQPRRFSQPRWQGEPLPPGSILLIYSEQGLGDTIQFLRYLEPVRLRIPGSRIILEVQPAIVRLLDSAVELCHPEQSERPASSASGSLQIHPHGQLLPPFTHHHALLSLPALFQTTLETIPAQIPYLRPNLELAQKRRGELAALNHHPKIGINWAGNPRYRVDQERSTTLRTFLPLLELPNLNFISLQHGPPATQVQQIPEPRRPHDLSSMDLDLANAAALIHHLDLVITTDTSIAHLTGALGKPLWLLLPWQSDWRWMQHILTTPWYPTARLFRQSSPGNWPELIHRVARELQEWQTSVNQLTCCRCDTTELVPFAPIERAPNETLCPRLLNTS